MDNKNLQHDELFGIHPQQYFLIGILNAVKQLITEHGIEIANIEHQYYRERYTFSSANELTKVDVIYDNKNHISTVSPVTVSDLSIKLSSLLKPLEGKLIVINNPLDNQGGEQFNFGETFLQEFYERINEICLRKNITVDDIKHNEWHERYIFKKNNEIATFNFFYNSKKQFKKYSPLRNGCTSSELIKEIDEVMEEMSL